MVRHAYMYEGDDAECWRSERVIFGRAAISSRITMPSVNMRSPKYTVYHLVIDPTKAAGKSKRKRDTQAFEQQQLVGAVCSGSLLSSFLTRVRSHQYTYVEDGKESATYIKAVHHRGVKPVELAEDNLFVTRALFEGFTQVATPTYGNLVYARGCKAAEYHATFLNRLDIAITGGNEADLRKQRQVAISISADPPPTFEGSKEDLEVNLPVIGKAAMLNDEGGWSHWWLRHDWTGKLKGRWVRDEQFESKWEYEHTLWALHKRQTTIETALEDRLFINFIDCTETDDESRLLYVKNLISAIEMPLQDNEMLDSEERSDDVEESNVEEGSDVEEEAGNEGALDNAGSAGEPQSGSAEGLVFPDRSHAESESDSGSSDDES